jgi:hypothetical protein
MKYTPKSALKNLYKIIDKIHRSYAGSDGVTKTDIVLKLIKGLELTVIKEWDGKEIVFEWPCIFKSYDEVVPNYIIVKYVLVESVFGRRPHLSLEGLSLTGVDLNSVKD